MQTVTWSTTVLKAERVDIIPLWGLLPCTERTGNEGWKDPMLTLREKRGGNRRETKQGFTGRAECQEAAGKIAEMSASSLFVDKKRQGARQVK